MSQKISPAVAAVIVIVIVALLGFVGYKMAFSPKGVVGQVPATAANPNGYTPPAGGSSGGPPSVGR